MNAPPAEITSGCWPGKPQWPLPAEKTTMMPFDTASAIAAASAVSAALSGPNWLLDPQLQLMMCGESATAALNDPIVFAKLILTMVKSMSGATANALADSAVPCPTSSLFALIVAGPRTTGDERYPRPTKYGCRNQPVSHITTLTPRPVRPARCARSAFVPSDTSPGTSRCQ